MARIVVLVHENDEFDRIYLMHEVLDVMAERGHEIVVQRGVRGSIPKGDLVVNHVDLTEVPVDYLAVLRQFPASVNGRAIDISKRTVSRHLVRRNDDFGGPVIVKANYNSNGYREARIGAGAALPEYRVYERKGLVPDLVWGNRFLIVEKFLPEIIDDFFVLRIWFFCGDQRGHGVCYGRDPVLKLRNVEKAEILQEPPPEALYQIREDLAFDFGKFDYAVVDGEVVLYDANRTPTLGDIKKEHYINLVTRLANGLETYL